MKKEREASIVLQIRLKALRRTPSCGGVGLESEDEVLERFRSVTGYAVRQNGVTKLIRRS